MSRNHSFIVVSRRKSRAKLVALSLDALSQHYEMKEVIFHPPWQQAQRSAADDLPRPFRILSEPVLAPVQAKPLSKRLRRKAGLENRGLLEEKAREDAVRLMEEWAGPFSVSIVACYRRTLKWAFCFDLRFGFDHTESFVHPAFRRASVVVTSEYSVRDKPLIDFISHVEPICGTDGFA